MDKSFHFYTRVTQIELLGREARNIKELLEGIRIVPHSSIYHHTHRFLEQHRYFSPEHPNDFSYWITNSLGLKKLGEKIASVDLFQFSNIELLRKKFIEILEEYIKITPKLRDCIPGEEFHFLSSRIFILPTPFVARSLEEFILCLEKVTIHSLYFHMFEARMRLKKTTNDFSLWLKDAGFIELAVKISRLDPYTYTLEGLRKKLIKLVKEELNKNG